MEMYPSTEGVKMCYTSAPMKLPSLWKAPHMPGHSNLHLYQFVSLDSLTSASLTLTINDPALK